MANLRLQLDPTVPTRQSKVGVEIASKASIRATPRDHVDAGVLISRRLVSPLPKTAILRPNRFQYKLRASALRLGLVIFYHEASPCLSDPFGTGDSVQLS